MPEQRKVCSDRDNMRAVPDRPVDLNEVVYSTKGQRISQVSPGVFFYYSTVTVAAGSSATFLIDQSNDGPLGFANFAVLNNANIHVYTSRCEDYRTFSSSQSNGDVAVTVNNAGTNEDFVVSVKYEANSIAGTAAPPTNAPTVHYTFETKLNDVTGIVLDSDGNGLDLKKKQGRP